MAKNAILIMIETIKEAQHYRTQDNSMEQKKAIAVVAKT
jgi:hypothetical protein